MRALLQLTLANIRTFLRDRAALFWTLAFPLIFVVLFGSIFSGGQGTRDIGWADQDATPASAQLRDQFKAAPNVALTDGSETDLQAKMKTGELSAIVVVPKGYGAGLSAASGGGGPAVKLGVYTDPTQQAQTASTIQLVQGVLAGVNIAISGRPPVVGFEPRTIQTQNLSFISYLVPSILGMALMQLGVFSAVPLVADREKLILKRLNATPLRRWQLVGSNVLMRLLIGIVQTVIIIAVGARLYGVQLSGNFLVLGALVVLGSLTFISLGYVIASFAPTEDAANGMTSVVQFPLMFLSGTFFPIDAMPDFLKTIARALPLTYLSDGLRQVMVDGTPFAPLWVCFAVLAAFLVICFTISARFFRWQ
ncbi:MAG TPA: ABC transporter permease [Candidatus Limnocylindrales bacterium]|jgi:ABC-2 type transport system permease protein